MEPEDRPASSIANASVNNRRLNPRHASDRAFMPDVPQRHFRGTFPNAGITPADEQTGPWFGGAGRTFFERSLRCVHKWPEDDKSGRAHTARPPHSFNLLGCVPRCPQLGQQRRPSAPRWYPRGHARPAANGWQRPPGPRQNPGPHPSATLIIALSGVASGAGLTAALTAVVTPKANVTVKNIALMVMLVFPCV